MRYTLTSAIPLHVFILVILLIEKVVSYDHSDLPTVDWGMWDCRLMLGQCQTTGDFTFDTFYNSNTVNPLNQQGNRSGEDKYNDRKFEIININKCKWGDDGTLNIYPSNDQTSWMVCGYFGDFYTLVSNAKYTSIQLKAIKFTNPNGGLMYCHMFKFKDVKDKSGDYKVARITVKHKY